VIAHETGHVVQRHIARGYLAQSRMSLASTAALLAAILIGAATGAGGQAMEGAIALSQATALQQSINYTRGQESRPMRSASSCCRAPASIRTKWRASSSPCRAPKACRWPYSALLVDHPVTSDRIAAARNRAANFRRVKLLPESLSFAFFKERCACCRHRRKCTWISTMPRFAIDVH